MASTSTLPLPPVPDTLLTEKHIAYIQGLDKNKDSLAYHMTTHLRVNGVYWGLCALHILGKPDALDRQALIDFVESCWDDRVGGYGAHPGHDPHVHTTLSAIQVLCMVNAEDILQERQDKLVAYLLGLQDKETGHFVGDVWGEVDTRFTYCAVSALMHLGRLDALDRELTLGFVMRCHNFDGGFGAREGSESHAAQVFTCVGVLTVLDALDRVDVDTVGWWLSERQLSGGGLNGRPEKLEDVCYSWWVLSSLSMVGRLHWIESEKLSKFILAAQDPEGGGIADRPDNVADVFHTLFGVAGLSLLGYPNLEPVDPVYCMPPHVVKRLGMQRPYQVLDRPLRRAEASGSS